MTRQNWLILAAALLTGCGSVPNDSAAASDAPPLLGREALVAAQATQVTLSPGWNPLAFTARRLTGVSAPGVAGLAFYRSGAYQTVAPSDSLDPYRGYFAFAQSAGTLSYSSAETGTEPREVNLEAGWNLVGFPEAGALTLSQLQALRSGQEVPLTSVVLTPFYDASSRPVDTTLQPGQPYWIFANAPVTLRWSGSSGLSLSPNPASVVAGQSLSLTASQAVSSWTVTPGSTNATITGDGRLTAATLVGTVTVTATTANGTSASREVTVLPTTEAHGVSSAWVGERNLSKNPSGVSGGTVGRNLATDSAGRIHAMYYQSSAPSGPRYVRSEDGGQTWTSPADFRSPPNPGGAAVNLATGPDDVVHAVWTEPVGSVRHLYYTRSLDKGRTWEASRDLSQSSSPNGVEAVGITVDAKNRVHLAWHTGDPDQATPACVVYYVRSTDGGASFGSVTRLSSETGKHAAFPRFTVTGSSSDVIGIAWRDNRRKPDWDVYLAVSENGGSSFSERVGTATAVNDWDPEVATDSRGRLHLTWMSYDGGTEHGISIRYARSEDAGRTWTSAQLVSDRRSRFPWIVVDPTDTQKLWCLFKDERDGAQPGQAETEAKADLALKSSSDGGQTWQALEFVTDLGPVEAKFHSLVLGPGRQPIVSWSDGRLGNGTECFYFKRRQ